MEINDEYLKTKFYSFANTFREILKKNWPSIEDLSTYCSHLDDEAGRLLVYACKKGFFHPSPELQKQINQWDEEAKLRPRPTLREVPQGIFREYCGLHIATNYSILENSPFSQWAAAFDKRAEVCEIIAERFVSGKNLREGLRNQQSEKADTQAPLPAATANEDRYLSDRATGAVLQASCFDTIPVCELRDRVSTLAPAEGEIPSSEYRNALINLENAISLHKAKWEEIGEPMPLRTSCGITCQASRKLPR